MNNKIVIYQNPEIGARIQHRDGEQKLGEKLRAMNIGKDLENQNLNAARCLKYVLLGIPESIGSIANFGKLCTEQPWLAYLNAFLNMQSNRFLTGDNILCRGHINTGALNTRAGMLDTKALKSIQKLRTQYARRNDQVYPMIAASDLRVDRVIAQNGWRGFNDGTGPEAG